MLCRISLRLGPTPQEPQGRSDYGYEITAPLDREGYLDASELRARHGHCRVARFAPGEPHRYGQLVYRSGRKGRGMWAIDYDISPCGDDEDACGLDEHCFEVGELVRLRDSHGAFQSFRVVRVVPLIGKDPRTGERPSAA
ncbi:MAG: hypothetical protein KF889_06495 [Alphaproteobacteria bacterium]|nr:hypothetical protein [Alphaproteobacteria bacterium]MCW5740468.1 hypothetical protein [Alphaproteobacteria bacterium]